MKKHLLVDVDGKRLMLRQGDKAPQKATRTVPETPL